MDFNKLSFDELKALLTRAGMPAGGDLSFFGPGPEYDLDKLSGVKTARLGRPGLLKVLKALAKKVPVTAPEPGTSRYDEMKARAAARSKKASQSGREIGDLPAVLNPERRELCRLNLRCFLLTYFAAAFYWTFGPDHLKVIDKLERTILTGGQFALAMPRSSGKTTLCRLGALWALLYGHRRYLVLVGATDRETQKNLMNPLRTAIETNDLLLEDFPEVCFPVRCLERIVSRARGQLYHGEPTRMSWGDDFIQLPWIKGSPSAGSVLSGYGLTGSIRGQNVTLPDGVNLRPEMVIVDDPQTRESASSAEQTKTRLMILQADIMGLAGLGKPLAALLPCTVIKPDDMADQLLDRKRHPEWGGERCKLLYEFPKNMDLWQEYAVKRQELQAEGLPLAGATEFYRDHREEMLEGARVGWSERKNPDDLDALQHAMNLFYDRGEEVFAAEYQNEPLRENTELYALTPDIVRKKVNGMERLKMPVDASYCVAALDVNYYAISYCVAAFRNDASCAVVDYGWYAENGKIVDPGSDRENEVTTILSALGRAVELIRSRNPGVRTLGIDGNRFTVPVERYVQTSRLPGIHTVVMRGYSAARYKEPSRTTAGLIGAPRTRCHLRINARSVVEGLFDSHFWHYTQQRTWFLPVGAPGGSSLFGDRPASHVQFADQLCADVLMDLYDHDGKMVYEWRTSGKNEMSDCFTMAQCLVNLAGLDLTGSAQKVKAKQKRERRVLHG